MTLAMAARLQPFALDHHGHCQAEHRCLTDHALLSCQPSVHLGSNAQTARFPECITSLFSERHLACFRNNLRRPVIPKAAIRWTFSIFHSHCFMPLA
jgi:hypothetical protein